jgi:hypothetical protein
VQTKPDKERKSIIVEQIARIKERISGVVRLPDKDID